MTRAIIESEGDLTLFLEALRTTVKRWFDTGGGPMKLEAVVRDPQVVTVPKEGPDAGLPFVVPSPDHAFMLNEQIFNTLWVMTASTTLERAHEYPTQVLDLSDKIEKATGLRPTKIRTKDGEIPIKEDQG